MTRRLLLPTLITAALGWLGSTVPVAAQAELAYDVRFATKIDNDETSGYTGENGRTLIGAFLAPSIGLRLSGEHTLLTGVALHNRFGDKDKQFFLDWLCYYRFARGPHQVYAGAFPVEVGLQQESPLSLTDNQRFERQAVQGALYRYVGENGRYEAVFDWIGMMKADQRERIALWSNGRHDFGIWHLGYEFYTNHFSVRLNSEYDATDNLLISPYVGLHFTRWLPLDRLELTAGYVQTAQRERIQSMEFIFPKGGYLDLKAEKWGLFLDNRLYYGQQLLPYYYRPDLYLGHFGNDLYFSEPYYGTDYAYQTTHLYDRLSAGWRYRWKDVLEFDIEMVFHFAPQGKVANQQKATLRFCFDQDKLRGFKAVDKTN